MKLLSDDPQGSDGQTGGPTSPPNDMALAESFKLSYRFWPSLQSETYIIDNI